MAPRRKTVWEKIEGAYERKSGLMLNPYDVDTLYLMDDMVRQSIANDKEDRRKLTEKDLECPESGCGADVRRPKCFFELGAACPRHAIARKWREQNQTSKPKKR